MTEALRAEFVLGLEIVLLCGAVLLPAFRVLRGPAPMLGRRAPALAIHRAQRDSLERDRLAGLLQPNEHREAALEVDRRLLADASLTEAPDATDADMGVVRLLLLLTPIPLLALLLYAIGGHPALPSQPLRNRIVAAGARERSDAALVDALRDALSRKDPDAPDTRQGYMLLGQTEAARGDWAAAAAAWRVVLHGGFDPVVAVQAAEAQCRADGAVGADAAALFRRALADGSQDAPWRAMAEARIAQFEHAQDPH